MASAAARSGWIQHVGRLQLTNYTREEVTEWFENYDVKFGDPMNFIETVLQLREDYHTLGLNPDLSAAELHREQSGVIAIWGILQDIAVHPNHTHRLDAQNIINEVRGREAGEDENLILPDPLPRPYTGTDQRYPPYPPLTYMETPNDANIRDRYPRRQPEDPIPLPVMKLRQMGNGPPAPDNENNERLLNAVGMNLETTEIYRGAILNSLSTGQLDPGDLPYKYLDEPQEEVLNMPEDCPFITNPTPAHDPLLLDKRFWPALDIYDDRLGRFGSLGPTSYIYALMAWCRTVMAQPEVAKAFCIVFRGNPRRFQLDSTDELADEEGPTEEELNAMIGYIAKMFPSVHIYRNEPNGRNVLGYHARRTPTEVHVNGKLFDIVEEAERRGLNPASALHAIYLTMLHECGHYYFSLVHGPEINALLVTPRKLRFLISSSLEEHENYIKFNPWFSWRGEMGQMIEWLVFGVYTYVYSMEMPENLELILYVLALGSYPAQGDEQIHYGNYVAERLLHVPIRFENESMRLFIAICQEREALRLQQQQGELPELDGFRPLGDGTAEGIIRDMDQEMSDDEDEDEEMEDVQEKPILFEDVDEHFSGHRIGTNLAYRKAVWQVKGEIDQNAGIDPQSRNYTVRKELRGGRAFPGYETYPPWPWNNIERKQTTIYRRPEDIPLVPKYLPAIIKPYVLMLTILAYVGALLLYIAIWGWWDDFHWSIRVAHTMCAAIVSGGAYAIPLRLLLRPFGKVRPPRWDYYDWTVN